jgi:DNA-binding CsgD family transcriptional regulator
MALSGPLAIGVDDLLAQEGAIQTSGGRAEVAKMALPPTLRLTIVRRLSFLPDDILQVLRATSPALRRPCARRVSAAAAGGTRGRPQAGWHSLTPTQHTVVGLVAEGLSNPQIGDRLYISRRTVQAHLAHAFAKLDITSRAQLAALVAEHRDGQP